MAKKVSAQQNGSAGVATAANGQPAKTGNGQGEGDDAQWTAFEKAANTWRSIEGRMARDLELAELLLQPASQAEACFSLAEEGRLKKATFELWAAINLANQIEFEERGLPAIAEAQYLIEGAHEKWDSLSGAVKAKLEEAEAALAEALDEKKKLFVRAKAARKARGIARSAFRLHIKEKEERERAKNAARVAKLRQDGRKHSANDRDAADAVQADIAARTLESHTNGGNGRPMKGGKGRSGRPTQRQRGGAKKDRYLETAI